jgi:hypothetical protein
MRALIRRKIIDALAEPDCGARLFRFSASSGSAAHLKALHGGGSDSLGSSGDQYSLALEFLTLQYGHG